MYLKGMFVCFLNQTRVDRNLEFGPLTITKRQRHFFDNVLLVDIVVVTVMMRVAVCQVTNYDKQPEHPERVCIEADLLVL